MNNHKNAPKLFMMLLAGFAFLQATVHAQDSTNFQKNLNISRTVTKPQTTIDPRQVTIKPVIMSWTLTSVYDKTPKVFPGNSTKPYEDINLYRAHIRVVAKDVIGLSNLKVEGSGTETAYTISGNFLSDKGNVTATGKQTELVFESDINYLGSIFGPTFLNFVATATGTNGITAVGKLSFAVPLLIQ